MSFTHGMNVEAVRALAARIDGAAGELDQVRTGTEAITGQVSSEWSGADALSFNSTWSHQHRPALQTAADALRELARVARSQADEQESASGGSGSGSGSAFAARGRAGAPSAAGGPWDPAGDLWSMSQRSLAFVGGLEAIKDLIPGGESLFQGNDLKLFKGLGGAAAGMGLLDAFSDMNRDPEDRGAQFEAAGSLFDIAGVATKGGSSTLLGGAGGFFGAASDAVDAGERFAAGDVAGGVYSAVHGAASGFGVVFPPVAACVAAADAGTAIGTGLGNAYLATPVGEADQQATLEWGQKMVGGDPTNDPEAAARLVERYEGVQGLGNFLYDSAASKASGLFKMMGIG